MGPILNRDSLILQFDYTLKNDTMLGVCFVGVRVESSIVTAGVHVLIWWQFWPREMFVLTCLYLQPLQRLYVCWWQFRVERFLVSGHAFYWCCRARFAFQSLGKHILKHWCKSFKNPCLTWSLKAMCLASALKSSSVAWGLVSQGGRRDHYLYLSANLLLLLRDRIFKVWECCGCFMGSILSHCKRVSWFLMYLGNLAAIPCITLKFFRFWPSTAAPMYYFFAGSSFQWWWMHLWQLNAVCWLFFNVDRIAIVTEWRLRRKRLRKIVAKLKFIKQALSPECFSSYFQMVICFIQTKLIQCK